jgi:tRNA pseudouridine38-40 synthase
MRWFFRVEYDGAKFAGWQAQSNARSVQSEIEAALSTVSRSRCKIVGAGRTDAGVHAAAQGAHVDLPEGIDIKKLEISVNAVLPQAVAIRDFTAVSQSFHARFSARKRTYSYYFAPRKRPLIYGRAWVLTRRIDWRMISLQARHLIGRHDFQAFCASNSGVRTTLCNVMDAGIRARGELRVFTITADRFLYKMVRSIAGTLVDIGLGVLDDSLEDILKSGDRKRVGETAPAWGLVLENVTYDEV